MRHDDWHFWVNMDKASISMPVFQSLEAFWPGLLVRLWWRLWGATVTRGGSLVDARGRPGRSVEDAAQLPPGVEAVRVHAGVLQCAQGRADAAEELVSAATR